MPGIEPGAFHMQSERSTTELHPRRKESHLYYIDYCICCPHNSTSPHM